MQSDVWTTAGALVGIGGLGGLTPVDLSKLLAGKIASASPTISTYTHGISGSASPRDLETALQLLYARFTQPGDDPEAFDLMKRQLGAFLAKVARLGGWLARSGDPPPGNTVMWRGWSRLADIMIGVELAQRRCG